MPLLQVLASSSPCLLVSLSPCLPLSLSSFLNPESRTPNPETRPIHRHWNRLLARQVWAGDGATAAGNLLGRALGDDLSALLSGRRGRSRAVDRCWRSPRGRAQRPSSVLPRSRSFSRPPSSRWLSRGMQPDGGLVKHVEHAAQPAAQLGRQADSLHLAAGERRGGPGERQVFEPHIDQELQPVVDFAANFARDFPLRVGELPTLEFRQEFGQGACGRSRRSCGREIARPPRRRGAGSRRRPNTRLHRPDAPVSPGTPAKPGWLLPRPDRGPCIGSGGRWRRAEGGGRRAECRSPRSLGRLLLPASALRLPPFFRHVKPLLARAVENQPANAAAEFFERHIDGNACAAGECIEHRREQRAAVAGPQAHGALGQCEFRIAQQGGRIRAGLRAQALAGRTPSQRAIEREVVR